MRFDRAALRRPAYWLALSITFVALPVLAACGSGAQLEPSTPNTSAGAQVAPTTTAASESASAAAPTDERLINLAIANRETTTTREDLRVTQGETVRLIFTTDEPGEIHLHGYDLTAEVSPEHPGELVFEATTAGAVRHQLSRSRRRRRALRHSNRGVGNTGQRSDHCGTGCAWRS